MSIFRLLVIAAAVGAAVAPVPSWVVEDLYSRRFYPAVQGVLTPVSNLVPIALLDVASLVLVLVLAIRFWRRARAAGVVRAITSSAIGLVTLCAVVFLAFIALWGLNYRRVPLEEKLEYDAARVTREAAVTLGAHAVREVNALHAEAHALDATSLDEARAALEPAFASAQRILGSRRLAVPGVPKRSLLEPYFRAASIDGMTVPFFLEVIVNPDALRFERPVVLLHEWAHLAGYANEAEANFVAWLACTQGDAMARYSGWLAVFEHAAASLPMSDRMKISAQLARGPRRDLAESAARYATATPVVRTAARDVYDGYLRANRVADGVASYTAVVRLILGAGLEEGKEVRLR